MNYETPVCIACGTSMKLLRPKCFDDRYGYPGYFDIYKCLNCQQAVTHPLLSESDLSPLYGNYYPRKSINIQELLAEGVDPTQSQTRREKYWSGTNNQGHYLALQGMVVLDYGCGAGLSLLEMKAMGIDAYGIEADPNVHQVIDALKLNIFIGSIEDAPFKKNMFDMIVLNQVIEHIPNPDKLLTKLKLYLKPNGKIVLSFPNVNSIYSRLFKNRWINWHIPYHLHHFNESSMRLFLNQNGWRVIKSRTITPNLWTILQFKIMGEEPLFGVKSHFWTSGELSVGLQKNKNPGILGILSNKRLQKWIGSMQNKPVPNALAYINRFIDKLHMGDSLVMEISAKEDIHK